MSHALDCSNEAVRNYMVPLTNSQENAHSLDAYKFVQLVAIPFAQHECKDNRAIWRMSKILYGWMFRCMIHILHRSVPQMLYIHSANVPN